MGIETEYGVLQPGRPLANPMLLSSHVVAVHAAAREGARAKARWDYDDEDPLKDARGFHLQRAAAHPSLLTDDPSRPAPSAEGTQLLPRTTVEEAFKRTNERYPDIQVTVYLYDWDANVDAAAHESSE